MLHHSGEYQGFPRLDLYLGQSLAEGSHVGILRTCYFELRFDFMASCLMEIDIVVRFQGSFCYICRFLIGIDNLVDRLGIRLLHFGRLKSLNSKQSKT